MLDWRDDVEFARFVAKLVTELMSYHGEEFARTQAGNAVGGDETAPHGALHIEYP
jgi:hypothetical protein